MAYKCLLDYATTGTLLIIGDCIFGSALVLADEQEPWCLTPYFWLMVSLSFYTFPANFGYFRLSLSHFKAIEHSDPSGNLLPVLFTLPSR